MSNGGGPGFLEFFMLEASDYIEQLDGLLLDGGSNGPDADALQRVARALRGTATMAKLPSFAALAGAVERIGRAIHDGALQWEPALGGALVAAIDDLKTLLRSARTWSPADDSRAAARSTELSRFAPARSPAATVASASAEAKGASASPHLAAEAANIAAGLELLTTRAGDADTAANVLRRIRALRGVAGVKEIGPLADTLEATEEAGRGLETGSEELTAEARRLLETAAGYLRTLSTALRDGDDVHAPSAARDAFEAASEAWSAGAAGDGAAGERQRIIPIADLFYSDGGSGVVEISQYPPTTAAERFRLELVSLGEHLGQVVAAARRASDSGSVSTVRAQRELRRAIHALEGTSESFGEHEVAEFIRARAPSPATNTIDAAGLTALADLAAVVAEPGAGGERLHERLRARPGAADVTSTIDAGVVHEAPGTTPASRVPLPPRPPVAPESVERLDPAAAALIDASIAALEMYSVGPALPHVPGADDASHIVPIDSLVYRGRGALDRAVEIRDTLRRSGPMSDPDALEELFDLLELARAE